MTHLSNEHKSQIGSLVKINSTVVKVPAYAKTAGSYGILLENLHSNLYTIKLLSKNLKLSDRVSLYKDEFDII